MMIPLALGAFRFDVAPTYERVLLAILAAIYVAFLLGWLIPVLRDTASGTLRVDLAKIEIFGRHRFTTIELAQCRAFTLSKTRNQISCESTAGRESVRRHFDHLRLSRQELTALVGLLNELSSAARGEAPDTAIKATSLSVALKALPPSHLMGPRLGPDGLLGYAAGTGHITCLTLLVCAVLFVPLAAMSVQCAEPVSATCATVAPIAFLTFLLMIPIVPLMVYLARRYRGTAHRLRDLDELPTRSAVWRAMIPFTPIRNRVAAEYGTPGTNRFGPVPPN